MRKNQGDRIPDTAPHAQPALLGGITGRIIQGITSRSWIQPQSLARDSMASEDVLDRDRGNTKTTAHSSEAFQSCQESEEEAPRGRRANQRVSAASSSWQGLTESDRVWQATGAISPEALPEPAMQDSSTVLNYSIVSLGNTDYELKEYRHPVIENTILRPLMNSKRNGFERYHGQDYTPPEGSFERVRVFARVVAAVIMKKAEVELQDVQASVERVKKIKKSRSQMIMSRASSHNAEDLQACLSLVKDLDNDDIRKNLGPWTAIVRGIQQAQVISQLAKHQYSEMCSLARRLFNSDDCIQKKLLLNALREKGKLMTQKRLLASTIADSAKKIFEENHCIFSDQDDAWFAQKHLQNRRKQVENRLAACIQRRQKEREEEHLRARERVDKMTKQIERLKTEIQRLHATASEDALTNRTRQLLNVSMAWERESLTEVVEKEQKCLENLRKELAWARNQQISALMRGLEANELDARKKPPES